MVAQVARSATLTRREVNMTLKLIDIIDHQAITDAACGNWRATGSRHEVRFQRRAHCAEAQLSQQPPGRNSDTNL